MSEDRRGVESQQFSTLSTATNTTYTRPNITTSIDSIFMDFDHQSGPDGATRNIESDRVEIEDYTTASSSPMHDFDNNNMPFSSELAYDFPIHDMPLKNRGEDDNITTSIQSSQANTVSSHDLGAQRVQSNMSVSGAGSAPAATVVNTNSVPEFLYQLTKMLTDNNSDVIEWAHGRIEVHSPQKLESDVLKKYFRHSKFASFQRQLNYFGFRKLAGKGKMAPCSYVNDAAMEDISSLFQIKRKSGPDPLESSLAKKKKDKPVRNTESITTVNPVLAGIYNRTAKQYRQENNPLEPQLSATSTDAITFSQASSRTSSAYTATTATNGSEVRTCNLGQNVNNKTTADKLGVHHELARRAIGRGIRHGYGSNVQNIPNLLPPVPTPLLPPVPLPQQQLRASTSTANSLSELVSNYQNSLKEDFNNGKDDRNNDSTSSPMERQDNSYGGFLSHNSSLIDLAMLAPVEDGLTDDGMDDTNDCDGFEFFDFTNSSS